MQVAADEHHEEDEADDDFETYEAASQHLPELHPLRLSIITSPPQPTSLLCTPAFTAVTAASSSSSSSSSSLPVRTETPTLTDTGPASSRLSVEALIQESSSSSTLAAASSSSSSSSSSSLSSSLSDPQVISAVSSPINSLTQPSSLYSSSCPSAVGLEATAVSNPSSIVGLQNRHSHNGTTATTNSNSSSSSNNSSEEEAGVSQQAPMSTPAPRRRIHHVIRPSFVRLESTARDCYILITEESFALGDSTGMCLSFDKSLKYARSYSVAAFNNPPLFRHSVGAVNDAVKDRCHVGLTRVDPSKESLTKLVDVEIWGFRHPHLRAPSHFVG